MTEKDARRWISDRFGAEAIERLEHFTGLMLQENHRQNLVSPASIDQVWTRHVLDSAQIVPLAPAEGGWLDVGTGGGFPGMVVGILRPQPTLLVEPRKRRAAFLEQCVAALGLGKQVSVAAKKVEQVSTLAAIISARAVASVENLLHAALPCATTSTRWLLPRGRYGDDDLAQLRERWRGVFHVKQSLTDPNSSILVADRVSRR